MGGRTRCLFGFLLVLVVGAQLSFALPAQAATESSGFTCSFFGFVLRPFGYCEKNEVAAEKEVVVNNRVFDIKSVVDKGLVAGESTSTIATPVSVTNSWGLSNAEAQRIAEDVYLRNENSLKTYSALLVALSMFAQNKALQDLRRSLSDSISQTRDDIARRGGSGDGSVDLSVGGTLTSPTITDPTISGNISLTGLPANALLFTDSAGNMSALSSLSVDDSGNLLIGTTTAQERLTVDGPIYLADSTPATTANRLYSIGGSLYWNGSIVTASSSANWSTVGGNVYRPTGSVGIGTTSPYAELSVVGDIALTGGIYDSGASLGTNGMILQSTGSTVGWVATSSLGLSANLNTGSLEDLGDVSSMTKSFGDLLYWNGSAWADIATSALAISTTNLTEGSNLFFTNARVASYINSSSTILTSNTESGLEAFLSGVTNVFTNNDVIGDANITDTITASNYLALADWYATTTDGLSEGSTNLYFTNARSDARFNTNLNATTTTALAEGSNLYYTLARFAAALSGTTTDALSEGSTNQYFTNARVASYILSSTTISRLGQSIDESELNITGSPTNGFVLQASSTATGGMVWVATSTLGISSGGGASAFTDLTDTPGTYSTGDIFYASSGSTIARLAAGGDGTVLKISGGVPTWGADLSSGGGAGMWASSTNNLLIYPSDTADVVVIGGSATTTTGFDLEVIGDALVSGIQASVATVTNAYVTSGLDVNGHVAIGNTALTSADRILNIDEAITNNNNFFSFYNNPKVTAALTGSRTGYGSYNLFEADAIVEGANDYTAVGVYGEVQVDGTSSVGSARAGQFIVDYNSNTGVGDNAYTLSSTLEVAGGATVSNGYGYFSDLDNQGTITNYYGIFLQDVVEGTMSNAYAFWTNQGDVVLDGDGNGVAGGNDGGSDLFFGEGQDAAIWYDGTNLNINPRVAGAGNVIVPTGRVGIGTTSPYAAMSVTGDLALTGGIYDNSATLGSAGQLMQSNGSGVDWVSTSTLNISTTNLTEGSNLFFTNARVASYINSSSTILTSNTESGLEAFLSGVTNVFTNNDVIGDANITDTITASNYLALADWYATTTDGLSEGSTNLYFTNARSDARFNTNLNATTTTALAEGSNLYFTSARASTTANAVLSATTSLPNLATLASLSTVGTVTSGVWQGSPIAAIYGGTGTTTYTTGDLLYAASSTALARLGIGGEGTVLKVSGGVPFWGTDISGGGTAAWSTSTNGLLVYTTDPNDVVVVGASATSSTGYAFEVNGNALVDGIFTTSATTTNLTVNSESFTDLTGDGLQNSVNTLAVNCSDLEGTGIQCSSNNFALDFTEFDTDSITEGSSNFWGKWAESFGKLYYNSGGTEQVGITDTDPDYSLEVAESNGSGYFALSATANGDGDVFEVDGTGNVGINDNSPSFRLDVNGTLRATGAALFNSTISALGASLTTATTTNLVVNNELFTDLTGNGLTNTAGLLSVSTSTLNINTDNLVEGVTNLFYTDTRTRASISETINGLTYTSGTGVFSLDGGYNIPLTASTTNWQTAYSWGNHSSAGYLSSVSPSDLSLTNGYVFRGGIGNTAEATSTLLIADNSNIGIGTSSPAYRLAVSGDVNITGALRSNGNAGTNGMVLQSTGTSFNWVATSTLGLGGGGNSLFTDAGASTYLTSLTDNLAIGTTSANAKLTVAGNINIDDPSSGLSFMGTRMFYASTSNASILIGELAGETFTDSQFYNVALGYQAAQNASSSVTSSSVFIGRNAGQNYSGTSAIAIGHNAGSSARDFGIYIGKYAGGLSRGSYNTFVGDFAGYSNIGGDNVVIGGQAGQNYQGVDSVIIGREAGKDARATSSVIIGSGALRSNTSVVLNNTVIGYNAGYSAQTGASNNILLGYQAANSLTTGANNIIIGYDVEAPSNTGSNQLNIGNLLFGTGVDGTGTTLSSGNIGIGTSSPSQKLTVAGNTRITGALYDNANSAGTNGMVLQTTGSGFNWVATSTLGLGGGNSVTFGSNNQLPFMNSGGTDFEYSSGLTFNGVTFSAPELNLTDTSTGYQIGGNRVFYATSSSNGLVALGYGAGLNTPGIRSIAIGYNALNTASSSAVQNVAIGYGALAGVTTGDSNVSIGYNTLSSNISGSGNVALGDQALRDNVSGASNFAIGGSSLLNLENGSDNVALGSSALTSLITGSNNIAIGANALLRSNATNSVAIGYEAGRGAVLGNFQNALILGYRAGYALDTGADNNILLGYQAANSLTTGANNIIIGYDVEAPSNTGSNQLNIGNLLFGTGVDGIGTTLSSGNIGIGTSSPASKLDVWGDLRVGTSSTPTLFTNTASQRVGILNSAPALALHIGSSAVTDSTNLLRLEDANSTCNFNADTGSPSCGSDITLKKDVDIIENELERIVALEPSTWRWKTDSFGAPLKSGFIAQAVEEEFPDLVTESLWVDGTTRKFLNVGGLMPYVVGAVKEQQETLEEMMITGSSTQGTSSPFYMMFDGVEDTIWEKMVNIAQGFGDGILKLVGIETEILYAKDITAETVTTDELCIGSTCVTESELQALLEGGGSNSGQTSNNDSGGGSNNNQNPPTPPPTDTGSTTSSTTDNGTDTTTDNSTTTTDGSDDDEIDETTTTDDDEESSEDTEDTPASDEEEEDGSNSADTNETEPPTSGGSVSSTPAT